MRRRGESKSASRPRRFHRLAARGLVLGDGELTLEKCREPIVHRPQRVELRTGERRYAQECQQDFPRFMPYLAFLLSSVPRFLEGHRCQLVSLERLRRRPAMNRRAISILRKRCDQYSYCTQ
jgi:hypothetical protein